MCLKVGEEWITDCFDHEQSLVFELPEGLVIFSSCSHAGADLIISEVRQVFPDREILAILGGFHLYNKTPEYVRNLAERIRSLERSVSIPGTVPVKRDMRSFGRNWGIRSISCAAGWRSGFEMKIMQCIF